MGVDRDEIFTADEETLECYLLGELPDEQKDAIEKRLVNDRALFEHLLAIEDELIIDYARGRLNSARASRVEELLRMVPRSEIRIAVARSLPRLVVEQSGADTAPEQTSARSWTRFRISNPVLAASAALVLLATGLSLWEVRRARIGNNITEILDERSASDALATSQSPGRILTMKLDAGQVRASGALPILNIPRGEHHVEFHLQHGETRRPSEFDVLIKAVGGSTVWTGRVPIDPLAADPDRLTVTVPSTIFESDDYVLSIAPVFEGRTGRALPGYAFSVSKDE